MKRYRLEIEYDGSGFCGWQKQPSGVSVQGVLEDAVEAFCGERAFIQGAGRTDAGVHALGQVAHVDLGWEGEGNRLREAVNFHLRPQPVSVLRVEGAGEGFHARFSARERRYLYRVVSRVSPVALLRGRVWHVKRALDMEAMREAAAFLVGRHDFTTFRSSGCGAKSPVKDLDLLDVGMRGEEIWFEARARSFLMNQVRGMVGACVAAGLGRIGAADVGEMLVACDRALCPAPAPAHGLYLARVVY